MVETKALRAHNGQKALKLNNSQNQNPSQNLDKKQWNYFEDLVMVKYLRDAGLMINNQETMQTPKN